MEAIKSLFKSHHSCGNWLLVYIDMRLDFVIYVLTTSKTRLCVCEVASEDAVWFQGKIECRESVYDKQNKLDVLLEHIKPLRNITLNVENTDIVIGRYDYPKVYHGVLRDCKIRLAEQYTIKHKQIIQVRNDDVFIYFDPPLMYDRCKLIGNLTTYIETPIAICGDAANRWSPRWNKMRSYVEYKERRTYVYGSTQYIIRQKMKLSLGPAKGDYDKDYKEYQLYGRQVLHYLNNCAKRIQRSWRRSISDPNYRICRERLQNEYHYLMDH
jgi:hypothetical protein